VPRFGLAGRAHKRRRDVHVGDSLRKKRRRPRGGAPPSDSGA
jgi:hypothetical protein